MARTMRDPLLLDADALRKLVSDGVVRRGLSYFRENRVTALRWEGRRVEAFVEGSVKGEAYETSAEADEDGDLDVECTCPFELEPACKHAVAVLLAYAARQPVSGDEADDAAGKATEERVRSGRTQVKVEHIGGDSVFGVWHARSVHLHGRAARTWRVEIRSVAERINHCTCPDFATNRLGTCKHVEAVLHKVRKRAPVKVRKAAAAGPPIPVVALDWEVDDGPRVRLRRPRRMGDGLGAVLDRHFDAAGELRGPLTDAFHRLAAELAGREDVLLGQDVRDYVERLDRDAAHRARGARIRSEIQATGGLLPGVRARLYPYQVEGVAFLASCGRALLADDMGLGKTLQAIAAATWLHREEGVRRTVVICPASLKDQWAREIRRFTGADVQIVQGGAKVRAGQYGRKATWTILNYELLLRDRAAIEETLLPDVLILDEAQRIKNWRTKTADVVKGLRTRYAFVLTGTPLENRLEDLYSLMQVVDPHVLGPLWRYLLEFHVADERGKVLGYRNLSELRRRLAPVMLRRDRRLVRDQLPDRIETIRDVPMTGPQQDLHDAAMKTAGTLAKISSRRPLTPSEEHRLMAALQQARMACDAAALVDKETKGSPKLDELTRLLEELCVEGGHKAVVFSEWERMTAMAEERARRLGLGVVRLHGGVPTAKRGALTERFREDPDCRVFLSTDAGGVGLNLQSASVVIHLDCPWNPAVLEQRTARAHRLGQRAAVQVVRLLAAEPAYEQDVARLVEGKRQLFEHTITEDATEDVVGMSKRALASLQEAAQARVESEAGDADQPDALAAVPEAPSSGQDGRTPEDFESEALQAVAARAAITALEGALGRRIERIVARLEGLIAVVDHLDPDVTDAVAAAQAAAGDSMAVGALDAPTYAALLRMGGLVPTADGAGDAGAGAVAARPSAPPPPPPPSQADLARRRLRAASVLLDGGCPDDALPPLVGAMLLALAHRAGVDPPPPADEGAVWVFCDLLPAGVVSADEAAAVARALALGSGHAVPEALVRQLLTDAQRLVPSPPVAPAFVEASARPAQSA